MTLYHSTSKYFLASIKRKGLVAQCGDGCFGLNKNQVGVYMWRHLDQARAVADTWRTRSDRRNGMVVAVEIPDTHLFLLRRDGEYFEDETEAWVYPADIPANWLKVL